ncbi:MAG: hypothetical protein FJ221_18195 [Lentisphaerae bacterium]|nr:hypothetical protein [Lentisphaerota bacterium]
MACAVLAFWMAHAAAGLSADPLPIPRRILAPHDSPLPRGLAGPEVHAGNIQRLVEMPLNHLGLVVDYLNVREGLPSPDSVPDVRGVLLWFDGDLSTDPEVFLTWCESMIDAGKRVVLIGNLPFDAAIQGGRIPHRRLDRFWSYLGLRWRDDPVQITYRTVVANKVSAMVEYERALPVSLLPYEATRASSPRVRSYLTVRDRDVRDSEADLVVTGPAGGYVAENYLAYHPKGAYFRQWYVNPFEFFREAFATDDLPKPDTTTLCGRRIYYSHIDGDGWHNESEVAAYKERHAASSEVICREILEAFPDLPVTVGPIAADLDPEWSGTRDDAVLARRIFALPNVEAGSHTYSHPLDWAACIGGAAAIRAASEADGTAEDEEDDNLSVFGAGGTGTNRNGRAGPSGGEIRRDPPGREASYDRGPFELRREIEGSIAFLNRLCPPGKRVAILQWSGNCCPFEEAVSQAREAGVRSLNGGDSRFDAEYPSCLWVAPVGRQVGGRRHAFASNSNEETYTDLWMDRYFGFRDLLETVRRTEEPVRLRAFNIYFHMYSGEKEASLAAVKSNLEFARRQEIVPVTTSHFAGIADGFYAARITPVGPLAWRIQDRDLLQTLRFDHAEARSVDFGASRGVIGERHVRDRLYVALDPSAPVALLVLREGPARAGPALPCLADSRWPVWDVHAGAAACSFRTAGFGPGDMAWRLPTPGPVRVRVARGDGTAREVRVEPRDGLHRFSPGPASAAAAEVSIEWSPVAP